MSEMSLAHTETSLAHILVLYGHTGTGRTVFHNESKSPTEDSSLVESALVLDQSNRFLASGEVTKAVETMERAVKHRRQMLGIPAPVSKVEPTENLCTCKSEYTPRKLIGNGGYEQAKAITAALIFNSTPDAPVQPRTRLPSLFKSVYGASQYAVKLRAELRIKVDRGLVWWRGPPHTVVSPIPNVRSHVRGLAQGVSLAVNALEVQDHLLISAHPEAPLNMIKRFFTRSQNLANPVGATMRLLMSSLFTKGQEIANDDPNTLDDIKCLESPLDKFMKQSTLEFLASSWRMDHNVKS